MTTDDLTLTPGARVLVAERHEPNLRQITDYLETAGHFVLAARDGEEALRCVRQDDPEVALLDVTLPRLNAYQVCERIKTHPNTRSMPVIMLVTPHAMDEKIRALEVGAEDFLPRPFNKLELLARIKSLVRVKRLNDQVETAESVIYGIAKMIEERECAQDLQTERLVRYTWLLGRAYGLGPEDLDSLRKGAALHDIGKIAIREDVLLKNGKLTEAEYNEIKLHPEIGERICAPLRCADQVLPLIRHHQERWDGKGYPDGLAGVQIPLLARILSVADAYNAMLSDRPYRPALSADEAQEQLRRGAGTQWDPELVDLFLREVLREERRAA